MPVVHASRPALMPFSKKRRRLDCALQQFVDCDKDFGDQGCNGGLMDQAFQYAMQSDGGHSGTNLGDKQTVTAGDLADSLGEVRRLKAELEEVRGQLVEEEQIHKQCEEQHQMSLNRLRMWLIDEMG